MKYGCSFLKFSGSYLACWVIFLVFTVNTWLPHKCTLLSNIYPVMNVWSKIDHLCDTCNQSLDLTLLCLLNVEFFNTNALNGDSQRLCKTFTSHTFKLTVLRKTCISHTFKLTVIARKVLRGFFDVCFKCWKILAFLETSSLNSIFQLKLDCI